MLPLPALLKDELQLLLVPVLLLLLQLRKLLLLQGHMGSHLDEAPVQARKDVELGQNNRFKRRLWNIGLLQGVLSR